MEKMHSILHSKGMWVLSVLFSLLIFLTAWHYVDRPLDRDELNRASFIAQKNLSHVTNPHLHFNHVVAQGAAYFMVAQWGANRVSLRLPSLIALIAYLVVTTVLVVEFKKWEIAWLVFLNHLSNGSVLFFMHSSRGYMLWMLFFAVNLLIVIRTLFDSKPISQRNLVALSIVSFLSSFNMLLGTVQTFFLAVSVVLFPYLIDEKKRKVVKLRSKKVTLALAIGLVPTLYWLPSRIYSMRSDFFSERPASSVINNFSAILGVETLFFNSCLLVFLCFIVLISIYRVGDLKNQFIKCFLGVSVVCILTAYLTLGITAFYQRYFLGYLLVGLVYVAGTLSYVKIKNLRLLGYAAAVGLLVLVPSRYQKNQFSYMLQNMAEYDSFMLKVKDKVLKDECILINEMVRAKDRGYRPMFEKAESFSRWGKQWYFKDQVYSPQKHCERTHLIVFSTRPTFEKKLTRHRMSFELGYQNAIGMAYYRESRDKSNWQLSNNYQKNQ